MVSVSTSWDEFACTFLLRSAPRPHRQGYVWAYIGNEDVSPHCCIFCFHYTSIFKNDCWMKWQWGISQLRFPRGTEILWRNGDGCYWTFNWEASLKRLKTTWSFLGKHSALMYSALAWEAYKWEQVDPDQWPHRVLLACLMVLHVLYFPRVWIAKC